MNNEMCKIGKIVCTPLEDSLLPYCLLQGLWSLKLNVFNCEMDNWTWELLKNFTAQYTEGLSLVSCSTDKSSHRVQIMSLRCC
jgi:hypothetical protein